MKKLAVSSIIVFLCVSGCGQDKAVEKGHVEPVQLHSVTPDSELTFFDSEKDSFHPKSLIESIRKKKLVSTGKNPNPSSIFVKDTEQAWYILNPKGSDLIKMELVRMVSNPIDIPSFPFDYENDIAALKRLYKSHKLDEVCKKDMSELEKLTSLMEYTYDFMEGGKVPEPGEVPGPSAEVITRLRRENGIGGTSREYAALYCQLALSLGFNARMVGMHTIDDNGEILTHDVCEVYLNNSDKWGVFDAYSKATYYTRNGIVLSALEIHNLVVDKNFRMINFVSRKADFQDTITLREILLQRYQYIYVWRMNNILGLSPRGGTITWEDLYRYHLVWEDPYTLVADGEFDRVAAFNGNGLDGVHYATHDENDFNWSLGHVRLSIERSVNEYFYVYLDTLMPNFTELKVTEGNEIHKIDQYTYKIEYMFGQVHFEAVNSLGVSGPVSSLSFPE